MPEFSSLPNLPSATALDEARKQLAKMRKRYELSTRPGRTGVPYLGAEFENDLHACLNSWIPNCVLPGVRVFSPSKRGTGELANELDNMFHLRSGDTDYVILVEGKAQPIEVRGGEWIVTYGDTEKCAREQVNNQIKALWEYLEPVARDIKIQFMALVVSPDPRTPEVDKTGHRNAELVLRPVDKILTFLQDRFNFRLADEMPNPELFRVSQSPFLDLLRWSMPIPALGHPELSSAIRYVNRCRRNLDETLFMDFKPRSERWLINGSAGMGKSVLLAYAAVVLSSGRELYQFQGEIGVKEATEALSTTAYDSSAGPIALLAMSAKQLDSLREWYDFFVDLFEEKDLGGDIHFRRPEFLLARNVGEWATFKRTFSAVFLDEAHDLPDHAARTLKELHDRQSYYLVVACDRHQQLRLSGADTRVMRGFDFSGKWIRLSQIYRNPAPVYIASLALMFRWFGDGGPKVMPDDRELHSSFGFDVSRFGGGETTLSMMNDAHPANSWSHVVAAFPDVATAAATLRREKLGRDDVLWVRYSEENTDFNYESLQEEFTYHNCRSREAPSLSDKYIKGQDFPVVVIEGFPSFMERYETEEEESKMWQFRRELYLCSSRATCFLYFICDVKENEKRSQIQLELSRILSAVGSPHAAASANGAKPWTFRISKPSVARKHDVFLDTNDIEELEGETGELPDAEVKGEQAEPKSAQPVAEEAPVEPASEVEPSPKPEPVLEEPVVSAAANQEAVGEPGDEDGEYWPLTIPEPMTTREFAELVGAGVHEVVEVLNDLGNFEDRNAPIEIATLAKVAPKFGCRVVDDEGNELPTEDLDPAKSGSDSAPARQSAGEDTPSSAPNETGKVKKVRKEFKPTSTNTSRYVISQGGRSVTLEVPIIVSELAAAMGLRPFKIMKNLIAQDTFVAAHQAIDPLVAARVSEEHGWLFRAETSGGEMPEDGKEALPPVTASFSEPDQKDDGPNDQVDKTFKIKKGVFVKAGTWILDGQHGIGKILEVSIDRKRRDRHVVWFAKTNRPRINHQLLGRTRQILEEESVPAHVRKNAPEV